LVPQDIEVDTSNGVQALWRTASSVYYASCPLADCSDAGAWSPIVEIANDAQATSPQNRANSLSTAVDRAGLLHAVYTSTQGLAELRQLTDGGWTEQQLTVCSGSQPYANALGILQGELPTLLVTDAGSPRIHFATPMSVNGETHAWYAGGP
jgi:hypothetical protein